MKKGTLLVILAAAALPAPASAEMVERTGTFAGLDVDYRVILPDGYDPAATYPVVLHFAGGPQTLDIVERSLAADWQAGAEARGYVVISPATPDGRLFFQGAEEIMPDFLDMIFATFNVEGGKLHVTGHSNGGRSAFHVAALYQERFVSVTGYPGLLAAQQEAELEPLAGLCIAMHVGDQDPSWAAAMEAEAEAYRRLGYAVSFTLEAGQGHRLDVGLDGLGERLFAELEEARAGC